MAATVNKGWVDVNPWWYFIHRLFVPQGLGEGFVHHIYFRDTNTPTKMLLCRLQIYTDVTVCVAEQIYVNWGRRHRWSYYLRDLKITHIQKQCQHDNEHTLNSSTHDDEFNLWKGLQTEKINRINSYKSSFYFPIFQFNYLLPEMAALVGRDALKIQNSSRRTHTSQRLCWSPLHLQSS